MDGITNIMANFDIIDIVRLSLWSSVLIAAVVIIRMFTLHKLPKKTFLVLWGIVVCRLLIPFSIPSHFSLYTGINMAQRFFDERNMLSSPPGIPIDVSLRHVLDTGGTYLEVGRMNVAFVSPAELLWLAVMFVFANIFRPISSAIGNSKCPCLLRTILQPVGCKNIPFADLYKYGKATVLIFR